MNTLKRCPRCKQEFPATLDYFPPRKSAKDGLRGWCKECDRAYKAKHYIDHADIYKERASNHYLENKETILERLKQHYQDDPEYYKQKSSNWYWNNIERAKESRRLYRVENKGRLRAAAIRRIKASPDKYRESQRKSRLKKPELYRAIRKAEKHRRIAREQELPYDLSTAEWQHALDYFNNCCAVCGRPLNGLFHKAAIDHWIPLNSPDCPGTVASNILPLCHGVGGCNNSKGDKNAAEWLIQRYSKRKAQQIIEHVEAYFRSLLP